MKRWDQNKAEQIEDVQVDCMLEEILAVCRRYGMSLGHEDEHGAFVVYRKHNAHAESWLRSAHVREEP